jgi:hypothetical protein
MIAVTLVSCGLLYLLFRRRLRMGKQEASSRQEERPPVPRVQNLEDGGGASGEFAESLVDANLSAKQAVKLTSFISIICYSFGWF